MFSISLIDLIRRCCFSEWDDDDFLSVQLLASEETEERNVEASVEPLPATASLPSGGLPPLTEAELLRNRSCFILRPNARLKEAYRKRKKPHIVFEWEFF